MQNPYVYEHEFEMRFADLDAYGHLNSSRYLDLLVTSRLLYPQQKFGLDMKFFLSKDIGYYMSRVEMNYIRPIVGLIRVKVQSWVEKVESKGFQIQFTMTSPDQQILYAKGNASIATVSLATGRAKPFESWMLEYLFQETAEVSV